MTRSSTWLATSVLRGRALGIGLNKTYLAWTTQNIERDEDRTRLANSAFKALPSSIKEIYTAEVLKHDLSLFCLGLWDFHQEQFEPEMTEGDPDAGPPTFILEPLVLEGGGTIIFAPPGRGKSYTGLLIAVSIDAGVAELWPVRQRRVLYVNLERSKISLRRRIAGVNVALGLPAKRPLLLQQARGKSLSEVIDIARRKVRQEEVGLVILDSISRAGMGDLNENQPVNTIIDALNGLCDTWLALGHTPRSDETHIYGGVHFEAGEDIGVQLLSQHIEDNTLGIGLKVVKANDVRMPGMSIFGMEFGLSGLQVAYKANNGQFPDLEAGVGAKTTVLEDVFNYILEVGEASGTEIARETGRDRANVATLLRSDKRFVVARKQGATVYYGLRTDRAQA